ncbi:MAG: leucine-rich repeat domain-containing protein, partial [Bacteroidia bacterium]
MKAGTSGDWEYQVLNDPVYGELNGGAVIFAYTGPGGAVVIPDSFNGVPVKRIGAQGGVFLNNLQNITNITVPHGTIWISDQAFANCVNLTEVILPNTLKHIGVGAFGNCTSLTNITFPNSLENLGDG